MNITIILNGKLTNLDVPPEKTLLEILRKDLRLTGTKKGCGRGECGACIVSMDKNLVNACLIPAFKANGAEILTIEGFSQTKEFQAIEAGFEKMNVSLCGFCASGIVMSVEDLLSHNLNPTEADIRESLSGNNCRCMGSSGIIEGVMEAAKARWRKRK